MDTYNDSGGDVDELWVGPALNMVPPPLGKLRVGATLNMVGDGIVILGSNVGAGSQTISPVDHLFPALVDCFGIILLGYLAGR